MDEWVNKFLKMNDGEFMYFLSDVDTEIRRRFNRKILLEKLERKENEN